MERKVKLRNGLALVAQIFVAVATVVCIATFFTTGGEGNMQVAGWKAFCYFTVDSNVLAALTGLVCVPYELRALRTGKDELPHWALIVNMVGTAAVSVTLMVCVLFLGFIYGYPALFTGSSFFLHGANPVLCIVVFMALLRGPVSLRESLWCLLPVALYGCLYFAMVILIGQARGGWEDFYAFNMGGMWYVSVVAMGVLTFVLATLLRLPHRARKSML